MEKIGLVNRTAPAHKAKTTQWWLKDNEPELREHKDWPPTLDRFNVHRCPTRRVFSGTGLEPVTKQATVRYPYHSATAATSRSQSEVPRDLHKLRGGNRRSTASDLSRQLSSATGTTVSRQTVYRRLGHIGLYARRPVRCVPLTATHCSCD
ncbi:transposable element Tcb1 transposase [Trichonephila clavipes]|nr:transposable element Tcb1 transposase [Trichonephila clavipes]